MVITLRIIFFLLQFYVPKPYSFGYAIKDKHGEQHRQEIGDGLHKVTGSYGFKDERGIERQVNYIADKEGFRAEIKTNEPGTASLNPAGVKMESSAHPYFGTSKGKEEAAVASNDGFALGNEFGFPGFIKFDETELAKESGLAFDTGLAKENDLEKEPLTSKVNEDLAFGGLEKPAEESFALSPVASEEGAKEAETAKILEASSGLDLEELYKRGFALIPINIKSEKDVSLEKEGLATEKVLGVEELAELGLPFPPLFVQKNLPFGLTDPFFKKEIQGFGKFAEVFPFAQKFPKATFPFTGPLPFLASKPKGFVYGGPVVGGIIKGYDARLY